MAALQTGFAAVCAACALVCGVTALWVYLTQDVAGSGWFVANLVAGAVWTGAYAVMFGLETLYVPLMYLQQIAGTANVLAWVGFGTTFAGRFSPRATTVRRAVVAVGLGFVFLLLTDPLHGLYWTLEADPRVFYHLAEVPGPGLRLFAPFAFGCAAIGTYYVARVLLSSPARSSLSLLVLLLGAAFGASLPLLSKLGVGPVPRLDYSALGIAPWAVCTTVAVFGLGLLRVRPVARSAVVRQLPDGVVTLDADGTVVDYNEAAAALGGGDVLEAAAFADAFPAVADAVELDAAPTTAQATVGAEPDRVDLSVRVSPLGDGTAELGYAVVLRDVTELRETERDLRRRNEQLDMLAAAVSHDLRNPLAVARGYAERVESDGDDEAGATIVEAIDRAETIADDLRTLATGGQSVAADALDTVGLARVVRDAWSNVETDDATLDVDVGADVTVEADRERLLRLLENLVKNTVDHAGDAPRATVGLLDPDTGDDGRQTGFYYADDGPGVPPGDRAHVFDYGYTTSDDGTGLGLAIVRTMAEAHGWHVALADDTDGFRIRVTGVETVGADGGVDTPPERRGGIRD